MNCPICGGKSYIQSTRKNIRLRKCRDCDHNFRTKKHESLYCERKEIEDTLNYFGATVREATICRLIEESSVNEIRQYFSQAENIILNFQHRTGETIEDTTGFIINAILTRQPIPYQIITNGNGNHNKENKEIVIAEDDRATDHIQIWQDALEKLRLSLPEATYRSLMLADSEAIGLIGNYLIIKLEKQDARAWLEGRIYQTVEKAAGGNWEVKFIC